MKVQMGRFAVPPFLLPCIVLVVAVGACVHLARPAQWMQRAELVVYDLLVRASAGERTDANVALVTVTEGDIQRLGEWPLPDAAIARLLERLLEAGADAVGLDVYRDLPVPPGTEALSTVLRSSDRIFAVHKLAGEGAPGVAGPAALEGSGRLGFADMVVDADGSARRALLYASDGQGTHTALGVQLAYAWLSRRGISAEADRSDPRVLALGGTALVPLRPDDGGYSGLDSAGYQVLLDFEGGAGTFPTFSLHDVIDGRAGAKALDGRIVLVGVNADSVKDAFATPLSGAAAHGRTLPGVALHGFVASQLVGAALEGRQPVRGARGPFVLAWTMLWALLGALSGYWGRGMARTAAAVVCAVAVLGTCVAAAYALRWWLPAVAPGAAWLASAGLAVAWSYAREKRDRDMLDQLFVRHVSPEVAACIWRERERVLASGRITPRALTCTTMFTDMAGFSTQAAGLEPEQLMRWVSEYTDAMTELIMSHGGVIDDYAGDGIKASFGVPLARKNEAAVDADARAAAACSLAMRGELERLAAHWADTGLPATRVRVGLNTGPVIIGTIGSRNRMKFTTVGDSVNVAARLEGLDLTAAPAVDVPELDVRILVSGTTKERLGNAFDTQALGPRALKGQPAPVQTFLLLDAAAPAGAIDDTAQGISRRTRSARLG